MRKLLVILLLLVTVGLSAQDKKYFPDVVWRTRVDSVIMVDSITYRVKVDPIDFSEPGAINRIIGNYLKDFSGVSYKIIDSTSTNIIVVDSLGVGRGPQQGQIGIVYRSVGGSPYLAPIFYQYLDKTAFDYSRQIELAVLWELPGYYLNDSANIVWFNDTLKFIATKDDLKNFTTTGTTLEQEVKKSSHGFSIGNWIRYNGTDYVKAQANTAVNADVLGVVKSVTDTSFVFQFGGIYEEGSWSLGVNYFLSVDTSGVATSGITYKPGDIRVFLGTGVPGGLLLEIDVGLEISLSNPVDTIIGSNIVTISSTGGSYTIGADLKKLISDQTATVNDSIPWIDNDNGGRKMALSTLKSLSATSPAGTDGQIQYNNSGSFAGFGSYSSSRLQPGVPVELHTTTSSTNAYLTFDNTTKQVFAGNGTAAIPANFKKRQELTSASSMTMNFLSGSKASFTLAHSATLTITNLPDGEDGIISVTQGASTAYTLTIEGSTGYTTKKLFGANDAIDATLSKITKIVYERVGSQLHLSYVYEN